MSKKNSEAKRKYWAGIPEEKRIEIARSNALSRWFKTTPRQRKKYAMKMVKARKLKVRSESEENVIKINRK